MPIWFICVCVCVCVCFVVMRRSAFDEVLPDAYKLITSLEYLKP